MTTKKFDVEILDTKFNEIIAKETVKASYQLQACRKLAKLFPVNYAETRADGRARYVFLSKEVA